MLCNLNESPVDESSFLKTFADLPKKTTLKVENYKPNHKRKARLNSNSVALSSVPTFSCILPTLGVTH